MKQPLKVSPLVKYTLPKYPAFDDANPMNAPIEAAAKTGYYKMALFSVVSLFTCNPQSIGTVASLQSDNSTPPPKENPIKFEDLGFPHYYAKFGTGLPSRLERETAVRIIDRLFKENKIALKKDYLFSQTGIDFKATGYNEKLGIGYVWLDGENTAEECYKSWRRPHYLFKKMLPEDRAVYDEIKTIEDRDAQRKARRILFSKLENKSYYKLIAIQNHFYYSSNKKNHEEIQNYLDENPNKNKPNYGEELLSKYDKEVLDLYEMQEIVVAEDYAIGAFSKYSSAATYAQYSFYKNRYANTKEQAIENLEKLVQDYIDWAKSEGRY